VTSLGIGIYEKILTANLTVFSKKESAQKSASYEVFIDSLARSVTELWRKFGPSKGLRILSGRTDALVLPLANTTIRRAQAVAIAKMIGDLLSRDVGSMHFVTFLLLHVKRLQSRIDLCWQQGWLSSRPIPV